MSMVKLFDGCAKLFMYFCVAMVLMFWAGLIVLGSHGCLTKDCFYRVAEVMYGIDMPPTSGRTFKRTDKNFEKITSDQIADSRSVGELDLALREQFIERGLVETRDLQQQLEEQVALYKKMCVAFHRKLEKLEKKNQDEGISKAREVIERMKPRQAKDQLVRMIVHDEESGLQTAVMIVMSLSHDKQKKIFSEFTGEQDKELLNKLLVEIRRNEPIHSLIHDTKRRLSEIAVRDT